MLSLYRNDRTRASLLAAAGLALSVLLMWLAGGASSSSAAHVTPVFVAGNPDCQDVRSGLLEAHRRDPVTAGTVQFMDAAGNSQSITVSNIVDGRFFDWSSTLGIDVVIVKGGPNANAYVYDADVDPAGESFGDTGLHAPINANNDQPFGLSHISFCYDPDPPTPTATNTPPPPTPTSTPPPPTATNTPPPTATSAPPATPTTETGTPAPTESPTPTPTETPFSEVEATQAAPTPTRSGDVGALPSTGGGGSAAGRSLLILGGLAGLGMAAIAASYWKSRRTS
jgi:hypothetical protein